MKVLVLGSGVIGVTSAYYLAKAGHEVTVVDRQPKPALETSFANAGEVSPGYSSPWAGPGVPVKAIKWLLMKHGPLVIRPKLDPVMWIWLLKMLRNCTAARYAVNKSRMIPIAEYSRDCLRALRSETGIRYDEREPRHAAAVPLRSRSSTAPPTTSPCSSNMACRMKCSTATAASPPSRRSLASQDKIRRRHCACRRTRPATATCSRRRWRLEAEKLGVQFAFNVGIERLNADGDAHHRRRHLDRTAAGRRLCAGARQLVAAAGEAARHFAAGLSGQGLFDHGADHRSPTPRRCRP